MRLAVWMLLCLPVSAIAQVDVTFALNRLNDKPAITLSGDVPPGVFRIELIGGKVFDQLVPPADQNDPGGNNDGNFVTWVAWNVSLPWSMSGGDVDGATLSSVLVSWNDVTVNLEGSGTSWAGTIGRRRP